MDGGKQAGTQTEGLGKGNDSSNRSNTGNNTSFSCIPKKCLACLGLRCVHYLARAASADENQKIISS
ncbi:MAG: hypothetical protein ACYC2T_07310 [Bacillota bacterium]